MADEEGYELDKKEVNADLKFLETNGALVHVEIVGIYHAGKPCVFTIGVTYP